MDTAGLAFEMLQSGKADRPEIYMAKFQAAIDTIQEQTVKMVANQFNGQIMALDEKIKKITKASKDVVIHLYNDAAIAPKYNNEQTDPMIEFDSDDTLGEFVDKVDALKKVIEDEFQITFPEIYDEG
jgi:hypothetical protein